MIERAELGIDGNCGFALLGENIQEGDVEFVEIEYDCEDIGFIQRRAATKAYRKLKERHPNISYFLGDSYP